MADQYGVPPWIPLDIAEEESGLNPSAVGDNGTSFGLFQLHKGGGQGDGYPVSALLDPLTNTTIAMRSIASAYQEARAQGLTGWDLLSYVASHSGHPTETGYMPSSYAQRLYQIYEQSGGADMSGLGGGGGTTPSIMPLTDQTPSAPDVFDAIDSAMRFEGLDLQTVLSPGQWIIHNFTALMLRVACILLGLILIVFGLVRALGTDTMLRMLPAAATASEEL
ncbi:MAG: transglycosylase SLT domain-containing protein [Acidobacterium ailaaui]|nr:transglycosylase SLT domain-containing protein [Pseudacidobacterium ailaaui]